MKNTASTTISIWPESESYFRCGLTCILDYNDDIKDILFLHLSLWSLKELLLDDLLWNSKKRIVIICAPSLMPVAAHWFNNNENIMLVIDSSSSLSVIQSIFRFSLVAGRLVYPYKAANRVFNDFEVDLIKRVLRGYKVDELASFYGRKKVTIYNIKRTIANDLGLRKLEQLYLPACMLRSRHPARLRFGSLCN